MPRAKTSTSKKVNMIQEPLVESDEEYEPESAPAPKPKPVKRVLGKTAKKVPKPATPPPSPVAEPEAAEDADYPEEDEAPAPARKAKKEKRPLSLWMQTLQEHGYMTRGSAFKPTPKKGSPEYVAVRAAFDAKKAGQ